ncbi:MAG: cell wall hydrolase [Hyphomicrobiales bacterium]
MEPDSGMKRRFALSIVNVVAAVGLLGAVAYAFIFAQGNDNTPVLAAYTGADDTIVIGGGVAAFSVEQVRVTNATRGALPAGKSPVAPPPTTGSLRDSTGTLRRIIIGSDSALMVRTAALVPDLNAMLGTSVVQQGAGRVQLVNLTPTNDGFSSTPLFDRRALRGARADFGATPAPTAVPLAARGNGGAVLTVAFAPSPFRVLDVTAQDRADLTQAEDILHKLRKEKKAQRNRRYARQRYCLAAAVYYEARGEPYRGQLAVAQVVMNRVNSSRYPGTICGVVFQNEKLFNRCQFSFACDGKPERPRPGAAWRTALKIASQFQNGKTYAPVKAATNYHADYVRPKWSRGMRRIGKIGKHIFYRT